MVQVHQGRYLKHLWHLHGLPPFSRWVFRSNRPGALRKHYALYPCGLTERHPHWEVSVPWCPLPGMPVDHWQPLSH